jgi:RNA polymerase sigma-32 factor
MARTYQDKNVPTDVDLITRYQAGDNKAGSELVERYQPFLHREAHRQHRRTRQIDLDDLYQEACCGFVTALRKYDASRSSLMTYAVWWVRAALGRYAMRNHSLVRPSMSVSGIACYHTLPRLLREFGEAYPRETQDQLLRRAAVDLGTTYEVVKQNHTMFNQPVVSLTRDDGHVEDLVSPSSADRACLHAEMRDLATSVARNPREEAIMRLRVLSEDPVTLSALADTWHVTRQRIQQVEVVLLKRLAAVKR